MRYLASFLLAFVFLIVAIDEVKSMDIFGDIIMSGNYEIGADITVHNGAWLEAYDIQVADSLRIFNSGEIHGVLNVCPNCTVELHNFGVFGADVSLQSGARIIQVITSGESVTDIGLSSGFDVAIRGANGLNLATIMQIASNADTVEITNSSLNARDMSHFNTMTNVSLDGDVFLHFDKVANTPVLLFSDANGDGVVFVSSDALDKLYAFETYKINQDIFVRLVRSTDYARILNNDMGRFLNDLRASGYDNKLFSKLDIATSMGELNSVLSHSVRTNPIKLMRPVSLMNSYKMLEIMHIDDEIVFGFEPIVIYSSEVWINGVQPNVTFNVSDDLHMKLSGYAVDFDYVDNLNEYDGMSIGLNADVQYDLSDNNFVRTHIGGGKSYFDIGPVFNGTSVVNNPKGMSVYAIGEFGRNFDIHGGYKLSPFIAFGMEYISVANANDTSTYGIGGTDVGYGYEFDGLRYDYSGRIIVRTDGAYGAGINLSAWSVFDEAGADMYIGTIYNNDFGLSLKIALNGRFRF